MEKPSRPVPVTIVCVLLMAGGVVAILHAFTGATAHHGAFHPAARALACLAVFTTVAGVWSMERWGLWTAVPAAFAFIGVDILFGAFHPVELLMPAASLCLLPWRRRFH